MATEEKVISTWHQEQVRQLYDGMPLALALNMLLALLMLGIMRDAVNRDHATFWYAILVLSLLFRGALYIYRQRAGARRNAVFWLNGYRATVIFTAAIWGGCALFLFPADITMQAYMAFVFAGISAAAMSSLSADRISAKAFLMFMLLPLVFSFLHAGSGMQHSMSLMIALFIVYMSAASTRMLHNIRENFRLRELEHGQNEKFQASEERFRYILDTCPTAARIARAGGHEVIYSNAQYAILINSGGSNVHGIDPAGYYANRQDYEDILQRLARGERIFDRLVELRIPEGAGWKTKWALATYLPIEFYGSKAVLGWFHDITERITSERLKSEFVSVVSHELRTPLTAMSGAIGLVLGGVTGPIPEHARDMLIMANRNSQRLSLLIDDLLDMEKLAAGKLRFELKTEAIQGLLVQSVEQNKAYGIDRNVGILLRPMVTDAYIQTDKHRFMQIMANLISNAIKYSPPGKEVEVFTEIEKDSIRICVRDFGEGIPEDFKQRIFEKFAQADSTDSRQKGGTGLGLAITHELVRQMGGDLGYTSEKNKGTVFYFSFPLASSSG